MSVLCCYHGPELLLQFKPIFPVQYLVSYAFTPYSPWGVSLPSTANSSSLLSGLMWSEGAPSFLPLSPNLDGDSQGVLRPPRHSPRDPGSLASAQGGCEKSQFFNLLTGFCSLPSANLLWPLCWPHWPFHLTLPHNQAAILRSLSVLYRKKVCKR